MPSTKDSTARALRPTWLPSQRTLHGDEPDWQDLASFSDSFVVDDRFVQRTGLLVGDLFKAEKRGPRVVVELRVRDRAT